MEPDRRITYETVCRLTQPSGHVITARFAAVGQSVGDPDDPRARVQNIVRAAVAPVVRPSLNQVLVANPALQLLHTSLNQVVVANAPPRGPPSHHNLVQTLERPPDGPFCHRNLVQTLRRHRPGPNIGRAAGTVPDVGVSPPDGVRLATRAVRAASGAAVRRKMPAFVLAVVEFVLLSVPSLVYLVVRRRRQQEPPADGPHVGAPRDYAWAAAVAVALGIFATRLMPADLVAAAGTTNRITGLLTGAAVEVRSGGEEVLFRGFLQGRRGQPVRSRGGRLGAGGGVPARPRTASRRSLPVWPILVVQLVTGLALGWLRARHDSIAPTVAVHVLANLVAGLVV